MADLKKSMKAQRAGEKSSGQQPAFKEQRRKRHGKPNSELISKKNRISRKHPVPPPIQKKLEALTRVSPDIEAQIQADVTEIRDILLEYYISDSDEKKILDTFEKWERLDDSRREMLSELTQHGYIPEGAVSPSLYMDHFILECKRTTFEKGTFDTAGVKFVRSVHDDLFEELEGDNQEAYRGYLRRSEVGAAGADKPPHSTPSIWEDMGEAVKSGQVRNQMAAYAKGIGHGVTDAVKGIYQMVRHPIETAEGMYELVVNFDKTKKGLGALVEQYIEAAKTDPLKFAEMTGSLVGQVEIALVSPAKVLKGRDVVGAIKTAGTMGKRALGMETKLLHYTNEAGAAGISASNKILSGGGKGAFATALAPELGGSGSVAGILAQNVFLGGRLDILRRVGNELKLIYIKPPFTHVVEFMSPEFKILARTNLEPGLMKWAKSLFAQYGAKGDQVVNVIMTQTLDEPAKMEALLNGMGYVVTDTGMVVHESQKATGAKTGTAESSTNN